MSPWLDHRAADRDLVISGEGRPDAQSLSGKLSTAVARLPLRRGRDVGIDSLPLREPDEWQCDGLHGGAEGKGRLVAPDVRDSAQARLHGDTASRCEKRVEREYGSPLL